MIVQVLQDALFAAIASVGFAAISRPPRRAYFYCAVIAAAAHSLRFILMSGDVNIVVATAISSFAAGTIAVFIIPYGKDTCRNVPLSCIASHDSGDVCLSFVRSYGYVHSR